MAKSTMAVLEKLYSDSIISKMYGCHSLVLSSQDRFLLGYLKDNVHVNNHHTIKELVS